MLLIYKKTKKEKLPFIDCENPYYQYENMASLKERLKEHFSDYSGQEEVPLIVMDEKIDEEHTLVDEVMRYLDIAVCDVYIIEPIKPYPFNKTKPNYVFEFSKSMGEKIARFNEHGAIHTIDDMKYFFIGF